MGRHVDNLRALDMPYIRAYNERSPRRIAKIHRLIADNPRGSAKLFADIAAPVIDLRD